MPKRGKIAPILCGVAILCVGAVAGCQKRAGERPQAKADTELRDNADGTDWPAFGRTYGEQHFSPLDQINRQTVSRLGLAWAMDLDAGNSATVPVAVGGVVYLSSGLSIVQAIDAATGRLLWRYDPGVGERAGDKLRAAWGIRGIAYWNGKVYTGTQDGRLIAIDAKTGHLVWSVDTTEKGDGRYITGAPRVFDGKIIIGHGGSDTSNTRGYVTTYDAETGRQLWRFFIVPGDPAKGFENKAMAMAAKTWTGKWWKYGGGGAAWNAFTYDPETDTVLVGTGNGSPWNQRIRSPGGGDNLFLCSMVALDAKTGAYKWHYQFNPGETWDYNAANDMELATLNIGGRLRKVVMTAPKNGFFYVIDRTNGKLISAEKIARVTWATKIDIATGRPVEVPGARFPNGTTFEMWPGYIGAHSWTPMAYSPITRLVYIPKIEAGATYSDRGIDLKNWRRTPRDAVDAGVIANGNLHDPLQNTSALLAWNPVTQRAAWEVKTVAGQSGGVLATAGGLVFQGQYDGRFSAYAADTGRELWHFQAQAAILAAPITYRVGNRQYITLSVGMGSGAGVDGHTHSRIPIDYRTQHRRLLTFVLDGKARLPAETEDRPKFPPDPDYRPDPALAKKGGALFAKCFACPGVDAVAGGSAPDLRRSGIVRSADAFKAIVHDGGLVPAGMPKFDELSDEDLAALRQYIRQRGVESSR